MCTYVTKHSFFRVYPRFFSDECTIILYESKENKNNTHKTHYFCLIDAYGTHMYNIFICQLGDEKVLRTM